VEGDPGCRLTNYATSEGEVSTGEEKSWGGKERLLSIEGIQKTQSVRGGGGRRAHGGGVLQWAQPCKRSSGFGETMTSNHGE